MRVYVILAYSFSRVPIIPKLAIVCVPRAEPVTTPIYIYRYIIGDTTMRESGCEKSIYEFGAGRRDSEIVLFQTGVILRLPKGREGIRVYMYVYSSTGKNRAEECGDSGRGSGTHRIYTYSHAENRSSRCLAVSTFAVRGENRGRTHRACNTDSCCAGHGAPHCGSPLVCV